MYIPTTLTELIEYGKNLELSHRNFNNKIFLHNVKTDETLKLPFNPIVNKYKDFFDSHIISLELTEEEQDKYWYSQSNYHMTTTVQLSIGPYCFI